MSRLATSVSTLRSASACGKCAWAVARVGGKDRRQNRVTPNPSHSGLQSSLSCPDKTRQQDSRDAWRVSVPTPATVVVVITIVSGGDVVAGIVVVAVEIIAVVGQMAVVLVATAAGNMGAAVLAGEVPVAVQYGQSSNVTKRSPQAVTRSNRAPPPRPR